jgi:sugar phosphate isomerase/epimerase
MSTCPELYKRDDEPDNDDAEIWTALYDNAEKLKELALSFGLKLLIFQPMSQYEGWPEGTPRSSWVREKAKKWLPLCSKLGVEFLQVSSTDDHRPLNHSG